MHALTYNVKTKYELSDHSLGEFPRATNLALLRYRSAVAEGCFCCTLACLREHRLDHMSPFLGAVFFTGFDVGREGSVSL